ncbi:hypothetical protein CVS40_1821 [Lucilia cuprina]|nr:hypothetical protein CVS40_1821 [Lucilia cuprina]
MLQLTNKEPANVEAGEKMLRAQRDQEIYNNLPTLLWAPSYNLTRTDRLFN